MDAVLFFQRYHMKGFRDTRGRLQGRLQGTPKTCFTPDGPALSLHDAQVTTDDATPSDRKNDTTDVAFSDTTDLSVTSQIVDET